MIWKMLKRKKKTSGNTTGKGMQAWVRFGQGMAELRKALRDNMTNTGQPKGKAGKLEYVWEGNRRFENGNKKWFFRKFEKSTFDDAVGFIKALEKRGFVRLGSGAFSTVLHKEGQNKVIKVIRRPDGWINYVKWAAEIGEAGKFAPKVFSYKKIKGRRNNFAVAVMEKLEYTLSNTPEEHALKVLPDLMSRVDNNPMAEKFTELLAPGLTAYMKKMAEEWKIKIAYFDLHDGNLMLRADGSFVVVDPVSRGEDKWNRLKAGDFGPLPLKSLALIGFYAVRTLRKLEAAA